MFSPSWTAPHPTPTPMRIRSISIGLNGVGEPKLEKIMVSVTSAFPGTSAPHCPTYPSTTATSYSPPHLGNAFFLTSSCPLIFSVHGWLACELIILILEACWCEMLVHTSWYDWLLCILKEFNRMRFRSGMEYWQSTWWSSLSQPCTTVEGIIRR